MISRSMMVGGLAARGIFKWATSRLDATVVLGITGSDGSPTMTPRGLIGNTVRTTQ